MPEPLLLAAASGLAREVLATVMVTGTHTVRGFLDDDLALVGTEIAGIPVIGPLEKVIDHPYAEVALCAGPGRTRSAMLDRLSGLGLSAARFATVVHPSVDIPPGCEVGRGTILLAGVVLTSDVSLGRHVVAMPHVTFTHDDVVGDFATFAAGVSLGGAVRVGERAYLGMNASVRERCSVGADAVLGMGAALVTDQPAGETWTGVPARRSERSQSAYVPVAAGAGRATGHRSGSTLLHEGD